MPDQSRLTKGYCNFPLTLVDTMSKEAVMILPMKDIIPAIVAKKKELFQQNRKPIKSRVHLGIKRGSKKFSFPELGFVLNQTPHVPEVVWKVGKGDTSVAPIDDQLPELCLHICRSGAAGGGGALARAHRREPHRRQAQADT
jgi:hypothetical protein